MNTTAVDPKSLKTFAEWQARQRFVWAILRKPVSRARLVDHMRRALAEVGADG